MDIVEKQAKLLLLFQDFYIFCKEHNIKFSLACGTALGCIREKGFIAWDGDLDVMMTLSEYLRMENISDKMHSGCALLNYKTSPSVPVFFGRIYPKDANENYLENYCYIDIHVYCGAPDNLKAVDTLLRKNRIRFKLFWLKNRKYHNIFKRKKNLLGFFLQKFLLPIPSEFFVSRFFKDANRYPMEQAKNMIDLPGYYGTREMIPKAWMDDYVIMPFENIDAPIISSWDLYLQQLYGDYSTPKRYKH